MILFLLSLLAGVLTVLAPCTISLLPVIVGGSIDASGYRRALTVTTSLGVSVIVFTLLLKVSSSFIAIPQEVWQWISGGIIFVLGLTLVFPQLWERWSFVGAVNRSSNRLLAVGYQKRDAVGDILMGAALGPVFSSCSPTYFLILASVLPRSLTEGMVYLLAYTAGLCGALLVATLTGQKLLGYFGVASDPHGRFKRGVGIIFLLLGVAIFTGYDKKLELLAANHIFDVTQIEQFLLNPHTSGPQTQVDEAGAPIQDQAVRARAKSALYSLAPEITSPSGFINTGGKPITIGQFKGDKVVLIDFWTYSCINCQRTLPYLKAWYEKYHDQGLEIISVHTPEFAFEKVYSNVETAAQKTFGLKYPVVLDNDYGTWGAFKNQFWPRKYLIDIDGFIVYDHAGEGSYEETEKAIQKALAERASILNVSSDAPAGGLVSSALPEKENNAASPETYFGAFRNEYLANGISGQVGRQTLHSPMIPLQNALYLNGVWDIFSEYAASVTNSSVVYKYTAKEVYLVMDADTPSDVEVWQDGVLSKTIVVKESKLYTLIQNTVKGAHTIELKTHTPGVRMYAFTFG